MALSYPLEIDTNPDYYRAMIEIKTFKTEPAAITKVAATESIKSAEGKSTSLADSLFGIAGSGLEAIGDTITSQTTGLFLEGKGGQALQNFKGKEVTGKEKIVPNDSFPGIKLYMPVSFQMTDTLSYNMAELGAAGAAALGVARADGGVGDAALAAMAQATAGISDTVGALVGNGQLGQLALARIGNKMKGGGLGAAAELAGQAVMNPNLRATFKSVGPRKFSFLFNFIPKSSAEAATVESIIYHLRKAAYPNELPQNDAVPLLFEYPDLFKITQKVKTSAGYEVQVGSPILYCYLENISVNINPIANNTFHEDGYPIQTDLTLGFAEYRTLSRSHIKPGYQQVESDPEKPDFDDEEDIGFDVPASPPRVFNPINASPDTEGPF